VADRRGPIRKYEIAPILRSFGFEVGDYRSGKQKVLCVFHGDTRPSAQVDFTAQRFRCFACGIGGDALDLLVSQEGISLSAAIDRAEALAGSEAGPVRPEPAQAPSLFDRPRAGRGRS
jgi:DNA primase